MKLISWNVNGLRAVINKGFKEFFSEIDKYAIRSYCAIHNINNDLKIQSIPTDKEHCLFLKAINNQDDFPSLYTFSNKNKKQGRR